MVGKKKGKSKKSKSGARKKDTDNQQNESGEAGLLEKPSSAGTARSKSGKKKKSQKLSAGEKNLLKLEKGVEQLRSNRFQFEHVVQVMDAWLLSKGDRVQALLSDIDAGNEGFVSYEEFKSVLYDMDCPVNSVECHLLCKLIDQENSGDIQYENLSKGLRWHMKQVLLAEQDDYEIDSEDDDDEPEPTVLKRGQSVKDIERCLCCKLGLWTPSSSDIKYIDLSMIFITFADTLRKHPCHFNKIVHTHITIYGLIQLIKSEVGIQSTTIAIFRDKTRSSESQLPSHMTLEQCGYDGRDWFNPMEHVLFYDYTSEFNDCPILMCDHYFQDTLKLS